MTHSTHIVVGKNPIIEALQQNLPIEKIFISHGHQDGKIRRIYKLARDQHIPIVQADNRKLQQMAPNTRHQGVVAIISPIPLLSLDDLWKQISHRKGNQCLAILDRIQDPQNLGAIIRSAEVLGIAGIILPARESAPLTATVIKASAGAIFHIPIARTGNLAQAVQFLKAKQFWIYGSHPRGEVELWQVDFRRNCAVVIGNESKGIRPGLIKACDTLFTIPQKGKTESLNASVAAGIIFTEFLRQNK